MFRSALASPAARRFFAAHAQSSLGTGLALLALPLLALDRFGSALAVSAVLLPDLLPAIVLGPLVGALVDRLGWRRCAAAADLLRCLGFLTVMSAHSLGVMMAGAALTGVGTALFHPAALAGLTRLAGEDRRAATLSLFGVLDDAGGTLGTAVGGVILALAAPAALLGLNAVTYAFSALLIATLPVPQDGGEPHDRRQSERSLFVDARAGLREVASRPQLRTLIASSTCVVLCIGVTSVGEVVLARQALGLGGSGLAVMIAAGGLGTILGSMSVRFTAAGSWRWRQAYLLGVGVMAFELVTCAFLHSPALVVVALFCGGFGNGMALVHDRLLLSSSTPCELHGRVFSVQRMCISVAFALSYLGAGALITAVGVRPALLTSGTGLALVALFVLPRLRRAWPAPERASLSARGEIAQLVEHTTENRGVPGSSPGLATSGGSPGPETGTAARLRLTDGSSPGLAVADEPSWVVAIAKPSRLVSASLYVLESAPAARRDAIVAHSAASS